MKPNWVSRPGLAPNEPAQLRILDTLDDAFHLAPFPVVGFNLRKLTRKYNEPPLRKWRRTMGNFVRATSLIGLQHRDGICPADEENLRGGKGKEAGERTSRGLV
ncbi:hypothetical protein KM043_005327 [Ampulex compressa]|nr:hypothetical protein KM043_005327 [Ampulex compressa]